MYYLVKPSNGTGFAFMTEGISIPYFRSWYIKMNIFSSSPTKLDKNQKYLLIYLKSVASISRKFCSCWSASKPHGKYCPRRWPSSAIAPITTGAIKDSRNFPALHSGPQPASSPQAHGLSPLRDIRFRSIYINSPNLRTNNFLQLSKSIFKPENPILGTD